MNRKWSLLIVVLLLITISLSIAPAFAQEVEVTPELTVAPVETVEATPVPDSGDVIINPGDGDVIVNPPADSTPQPSDNTLYVIGFILFLVVYGIREFVTTRQIGSLVTTVNKALDNKQVQDEAQRRYMEASLPAQEFVKLLGGIFAFLGAANLPVIDPLADKANEFLGNVTRGEDARPGEAG